MLNHCNHLGARTRGIESGLGDQIAFQIADMGRVASTLGRKGEPPNVRKRNTHSANTETTASKFPVPELLFLHDYFLGQT